MTSTLLFPDMVEPQSGFDFPITLAEKYRPTRIEDFAGLSEPKKILRGFATNPRNAAFLFCGPAGTGKTSMGLALASAIGGFLHHIPAGSRVVPRLHNREGIDMKKHNARVVPTGFGFTIACETCNHIKNNLSHLPQDLTQEEANSLLSHHIERWAEADEANAKDAARRNAHRAQCASITCESYLHY